MATLAPEGTGLESTTLFDKTRGSLLDGLIGDATGTPCENAGALNGARAIKKERIDKTRELTKRDQDDLARSLVETALKKRQALRDADRAFVAIQEEGT